MAQRRAPQATAAATVDYTPYLVAAKDLWVKGKAEQKNVGNFHVPPGEYTVRSDKFELGITSNKNPKVTRQHVVLEGEQAGVNLRDAIVLASDFQLALLHSWLTQVGFVDLSDDPRELIQVLADLNAQPYEAKVKVWYKEGDERYNVSILEVYEGAASADATTPPAPAPAAAPAVTPPSSQSVGVTGMTQEDQALLAEMLAFCAKENIELRPEIKSDIDGIIAEMGRYEFESTTLSDTEKSLLNDIGLTDRIYTEAPPAAPVPVAPAPAPVPPVRGRRGAAPAPAAPVPAAPPAPLPPTRRGRKA